MLSPQKNIALVKSKQPVVHTRRYTLVRGQRYIEIRNEDDQPLHKHLSDREYQVMCSIACGKEVKEISIELALSAKTISTYRAGYWKR